MATPSPISAVPKSILRRRSGSASPDHTHNQSQNRSRSSSPTTSPTQDLSRRKSGVHFEPPPHLQTILRRYFDDGQRNVDELEGFITHMRNQSGNALVAWLQTLQENVTLLRPDLERFVIEILKISWAAQDQAIVASFRQFLANLVSAHSYYVKPVMLMLTQHLLGRARTPDEVELETRAHTAVHDTIVAMLKLSPFTAKKVLLKYAKDCLPYTLVQHERTHTKYVENLTRMMGYLDAEEDRVTILRIILERLVTLDAHLPKLDQYVEESDEDGEEENMFSMDGASGSVAAAARPADSAVARRLLDNAMVVMFKYLDGRKDTRRLYSELLPVFESQVLPTYATGHVQFLLFRLLSRDEKLVSSFLDWLWAKFCDPNTPGIIRQSTVAYIASLVARAKFVDLSTTKRVLERMAQWAHAYIAARESTAIQDFMFVNIQAHGPFYAACQAVLYVFAFRHQEFVHDEKELAFLRSLNFGTLVTSHLNPLRVCLPPVVKNFAAISRHYQLVYCEAIVQRNSRISLPVVGSLSGAVGEAGKPLLLDSFFPFDPYTLKISGSFVADIYRVYAGAMIEEEDDSDEEDSDSDEDEEEEEEDMETQSVEGDDMVSDLINKTPQRSRIDSLSEFTYGTSPGFKR